MEEEAPGRVQGGKRSFSFFASPPLLSSETAMVKKACKKGSCSEIHQIKLSFKAT